jgi:hypothetical protein
MMQDRGLAFASDPRPAPAYGDDAFASSPMATRTCSEATVMNLGGIPAH